MFTGDTSADAVCGGAYPKGDEGNAVQIEGLDPKLGSIIVSSPLLHQLGRLRRKDRRADLWNHLERNRLLRQVLLKLLRNDLEELMNLLKLLLFDVLELLELLQLLRHNLQQLSDGRQQRRLRVGADPLGAVRRPPGWN
jgi:hypothetical protein